MRRELPENFVNPISSEQLGQALRTLPRELSQQEAQEFRRDLGYAAWSFSQTATVEDKTKTGDGEAKALLGNVRAGADKLAAALARLAYHERGMEYFDLELDRVFSPDTDELNEGRSSHKRLELETLLTAAIKATRRADQQFPEIVNRKQVGGPKTKTARRDLIFVCACIWRRFTGEIPEHIVLTPTSPVVLYQEGTAAGNRPLRAGQEHGPFVELVSIVLEAIGLDVGDMVREIQGFIRGGKYRHSPSAEVVGVLLDLGMDSEVSWYSELLDAEESTEEEDTLE